MCPGVALNLAQPPGPHPQSHWSREWQYALADWLWSRALPLGVQGISSGGFWSADSVKLKALAVAVCDFCLGSRKGRML